MRADDAWSRDVVLRAMCDAIARQRDAGVWVDFILVTGDIAFSGAVGEYERATDFFDALSAASGVPKHRIFFIPGNHDVNRDRQKMCFRGARDSLVSQNHVDTFLSPSEDLETLLLRQENYTRFLKSYCRDQERTATPDGLAYVAPITIDDVRLAIVGLNSAWLAEGGLSDHGRLIIGERQAIDALQEAHKLEPHLVIAMAHHPYHLLNEFDRGPVQRRLEGGCHFFHCGHLHQPETRMVGRAGRDCLVIAAGASFEARHSRNSYSLITLDLLNAGRTIETVEYTPWTGAFASAGTESFSVEITPAGSCSVQELSVELAASNAVLLAHKHYLAALLLNAKSEVPIPALGSFTFGSLEVLRAQPQSEVQRRTLEFKSFSNVLRIFYGRKLLPEILSKFGDTIVRYGSLLQELGELHPDLRARLADQEQEAKILADAERANRKAPSYAIALLTDIADAGDWLLLREYAERHLESPDRRVAGYARRMLAYGLAHSADPADKLKAVSLYKSAIAEGQGSAADIRNLARLLIERSDFSEAKDLILRAIREQGDAGSSALHEIGLSLVESTGDRDFRRQLDAAIAARDGRD